MPRQITRRPLRGFISLRLEALQLAPTSYHFNDAHESRFADTQWIERLTDPQRHDFICRYIVPDRDQNGETILEDRVEDKGSWIGMCTLLVPFR